MLTPDDNKLIEKYLNDSLTAEEIRTFKERFDENLIFAKEVKQHTDMRAALIAAAKHRTHLPKHTRVIKFRYIKLAVAASIILFFGLTTYYYLNKPNPYHQMYASFYVNPFDNNDQLIIRSAKTQADEIALGKFREAIALMENDRFTEAIAILQKLEQMNQNNLTNEIEWYLALALVREGQTDKAKELFAKISNSNSPFSSKALELYNQL